MALINTLRNRMGKLLVVVIGFSILAFVLADFLQNGSIFSGNETNVGEIAGETISLQEFQDIFREQEAGYVLRTKKQPTENEKDALRRQAWDMLVVEHAHNKQYEKVGSRVSTDEIWDMLQGKNINPSLRQSFTNPETGKYDRNQFLNYLQQLPSLQPEAQYQWEFFKTGLLESRVRMKYENLLTKTNYITNAEAKREYIHQNEVANIEYLYVPYSSVSESDVTVDKSEAKAYYNKNKERYKVEASRSVKYVAFDIIPSAADTAFTKEEVELLKQDFAAADNDSSFAVLNSDELTFYGKYHLGILPAPLKDSIGRFSSGDVIGPYLVPEGFKLFKISKIFEDTVYNARASHILIKGDDSEARSEATDILKEIRNGADFADMARKHGTDGTASRGGDLGWFESGRMVPEFEKAVFNAKTTGLLPNLVKTQFGYHIVKVDEMKTNKAYMIATITREILPGDETINEAFTKADIFASGVDDMASFEEKAKQNQLAVMSGNNLKPNDRGVGTMSKAREIVQWVFSKASVGSISEVFDLDEAYVVAVMTQGIEEGYKSFDEVAADINREVIKDEKGKLIIDQLKKLSGSLKEMSEAYGNQASVYTKEDMKITDTSLPGIGFDPKIAGTIFSMASGQTGKPIAGRNGVAVIRIESKTEAPDIADYSIYKDQLRQKVNSNTGSGISQVIEEYADIQDERYKFY